MTHSFRMKFHKWLILTASWVAIGILMAAYLHLYIGGEFIIASENYDFISSVVSGMAGGLLGGLLGGSVMIFVLEEKYKNRPFAFKALMNALFVMFVILVVNVIISFLYYLILMEENVHVGLFQVIGERLWSRDHFISQITWLTIVSVTTFAFSIVDSFGPHVFIDMLFGKYHRPFTEQRIFMFLDLKSSTTIAEKLGHEKYFGFLQEFYSDITNPVMDAQGNVYQYVGDEVVLSWDMYRGIKNQNCLNCFFMIQKEIEGLKPKYMEKYGVVPEFKAGLHYGKVTTGEVGIMKKEIIHTGDVLNTTARIENQCNWLNAELLVSKKLTELLGGKDKFQLVSMGKINLRGKSEMIELVGVSEGLKVERKLDTAAAGALQV